MAAALFWMILVATAALAVSVVLRPLWNAAPQGDAPEDPGQIYRAQLDDIARDLARGTINADEAQRLRAEVARRLLDLDRRNAANSRPPMTRTGLITAAGMVAAAGLGAIALYAYVGRADMPDMGLKSRLQAADAAYQNRPDQATAEAQMTAPTNQDPELLALLDQLRAVLKDRPDDQQGLEYLVQYEAQAGNFAAAAAAQRQLMGVKPEVTAEDHAVLAQNMIFAAGELVTPEAEAELARALAIDPSNARATYFLGLMFAQVGRPDKTLPLWQGLLITEPDSAPWTQPIRAMIEDIAAAAGQRFEMPALKGPSAAEVEAAATMEAEDQAAMIEGMVAGLEERLFSTGGSLEEWSQLLQALSVLGDGPRALKARAAGELAFANNPSYLAQLRQFADQLGILP